MKTMNLYNFSKLSIVVLGLSLTSCGNDPLSPGMEYMPDMYRTPAMEPYSGNNNYPDSMEARTPAPGSIARGYLPYGIPKSQEGYEMAGALLKNPLERNDQVLAEGKDIYTKFCMHCHGKEGAGDGLTVTAGGHPPPPAYTSASLKNLPEGKMFHSITYGKNLMGPHSSQLSVEERWKVIHYVQTLQNPEGVKTEEVAPEAVDTGDVASDQTALNN